MISIITPLYNSTKYFRRCCESVAAQSYQDFEWLLVDDHGEEDSVAVARQEGITYGLISKMRFFATEKNGGPGEARNVGLREAQGDYVVFLDADDWIEPNSYEFIVETMQSKSADMAYYNGIEHRKYSEGASAKEQTTPMITIPYKSQKQFLCNYVARITYCFKTSFLRKHNILFPSTRASEDSFFIAACTMLTNKIAGVDVPLYHYMIHTESVSQKCDPERAAQKRKSFKLLFAFAKEHKVWQEFKWQLRYIYIKKAILVPLIKG